MARSNSNCNMVDDVNSASSADCHTKQLEPDFRQAAFLPLEYNRLVPSGMLPSLINIDRTCWMLLSEGVSSSVRILRLTLPSLGGANGFARSRTESGECQACRPSVRQAGVVIKLADAGKRDLMAG
ncbi:hypothetical protein L227DRAFT_561161 [Lentinus tigrinus ALCF2SS1-6]|uniref:Uncharacterized protein n=1 Tax=Lentinus tigrinus ALCF2SS1-6 TaxID=1328759 RepID=A0A5C2SIK1_9APHY|nr:hypothetical protein L227DRAFT_561161 [Lentinus tigrinus ALCF2SS1-6]